MDRYEEMEYGALIRQVKAALASRLEVIGDHELDEKYIASSVRDYSEALRALEQARWTNRREN